MTACHLSGNATTRSLTHNNNNNNININNNNSKISADIESPIPFYHFYLAHSKLQRYPPDLHDRCQFSSFLVRSHTTESSTGMRQNKRKERKMEMITHHVDGRCPPCVAMASESFSASLRVRLRRDTAAFYSVELLFLLFCCFFSSFDLKMFFLCQSSAC